VTVYAIAQLRIHDPVRFGSYVAGFMPVLHKYGGQLLATDNRPDAIEGQWEGDRIVILAFQDRDAFTTWRNSTDYQEIVTHRLAAADTTFLLVQGVA
jgi:uncharacterized protein (DUF1330 family)